MWRATWAAVLLAVSAARSAGAQTGAGQGDAEAIYHLNLAIDLPVIAVTTVGGIIPFALSSRLIHPSCPCAASAVNGFDRGAIGNHNDPADWISTATVAVAIAVPPLADWFAVGSHRVWLDDAVVFAESLSVNGAFVTAAKYSVQRPIPRAYTDPAVAARPGSYRSFYSGHTSFAFAALSTAAVTVNLRTGLTWQPWAVTLLVGGSVAAERVVSGYHFPSDVIVGAAAGAAVGTLVPLLHLGTRRVRLSAFQPPSGLGAEVALSGVL